MTIESMSKFPAKMPDKPFYFPLTPNYSVGQAAPARLYPDQFGYGTIDGCVFQFAGDSASHLRFKSDLLSEHADQHVGRSGLSQHIESRVCSFMAERLLQDAPDRFREEELRGHSFDALAMLVPEDMAITCVRYGDDGQVTGDWLAAVHVCMPSGWRPAEMLGRSFAQVHRTVQVPATKRFLLENDRVKDYVGQMLACTQPHVRFIWTLQIGDALNRNPRTRKSTPALAVDSATGLSNIFFRVERQTITSFPDIGASLFTIRTYLYPLAEVIIEPERCALLKQAVADMPPRVIAYKGWSKDLVGFVAGL
jgi:hypothetical protein